MFGRTAGDAMSMQSSPSHEPIPLPTPGVGAKKALAQTRGGSKLRREASPPRKPPPRVESTQPRDTSPEPSSSGEETAGEEDYATPPAHYVAPVHGYDWPGAVMPIGEEDDDSADWVDEDDEDDPEDLLELEYHPTYVRMPEKRKRRWEIGWESLSQAVSFSFVLYLPG